MEEHNDSIECWHCGQWFHKRCANNLTVDEFATLCDSSHPNIAWICEICVDKNKNKSNSNTDSHSAILEEILKQLTNITQRLDLIEKNGKEEEDRVVKLVEEKVNEAMEELKEEEKRKNNIIISNVKEDGDDLIQIQTFFKEEVSISTDEVAEIYRLGKKREDAKFPRPIKVVLKSNRKDVLTKAAIKINKGRTQADRVYVNNDLTARQREADGKLRAELRERRTAGESVAIKNGKIVNTKHQLIPKEGGAASQSAH